MEKKLLWVFLVALLATNLGLNWHRGGMEREVMEVREQARVAWAEQDYTDEEEALVSGRRTLPADVMGEALQARDRSEEGGVHFLLIAGIHDCSNCIEDEVAKLNEFVGAQSPLIAGIHGFYVDGEQPDAVRSVIDHLRPTPAFAFRTQEVLSGIPGASTPLVLVVRARDLRILDAHKPIPEDLSKRDAFYERWNATLGNS